MLTTDLIKHVSGEYDLSVVQLLSLTSLELPSIMNLDLCINLKELNLSSNSLKTIGSGLSTLTKLTRLDLSNNLISSLNVEEFEPFGKTLEFLALEGNEISDVDDLYSFTPLVSLKTLYLSLADSTNPCCSNPSYYVKITKAFESGSGLNILDGESFVLKGSIGELVDDGGVKADEKFMKVLEVEKWLEDGDGENVEPIEIDIEVKDAEEQLQLELTEVDIKLK
ncbi:hypothetical protein TL16_g00223 [Triparma laevis f. inornata]|uniref:Uncharacterized protein n=1 Tax=Triparma laevis f. inornata TaxID=1714386 RepID=A0A9W7DN03_9STRA|nr:hypothetical protein TL16_g00223 [Triparma laevis f. inornata]